MLSKRQRKFLEKSEAKVRQQGFEAGLAFFLNNRDLITDEPTNGETPEAARENAYFARLIFDGLAVARQRITKENENARLLVEITNAVREAVRAFIKGEKLLENELNGDIFLTENVKTIYLAAAQIAVFMEFEAVYGEDAPKIRRRLMYNVPYWADEEAVAEENYLKDVMCEMFIDKKGIFAEKTN